MKGIKMSDCKFYVDEDARVIVCVIPETEDILRDFIVEHFQWSDINVEWALGYNFCKRLQMPYSFMGKAVCAPEDEWNEALGKKIAFACAKDKCYKSFFKRANLLVQTIDRRLGDMIEAFNDFGLKLDAKREALESQIESETKKEGDA